MRICLYLLFAVLLVLWTGLAMAAQVSGLYQTEVPVTGQESGERSRALRTALARVVIKVSGQRSAPQNPQVAEALKKPSRYVQQYRYRLATNDTGQVAPAPQQVLWAQFDGKAVNRLLAEAGLNVWGRERPAALIWLAVEDRGRRRLLGSDDGGVLLDALQARAAERGLPLILPLLDLEDQSRLRVTDVWGDFQDTVLAASGRYGSDAVLVGKAYKVLPGLWEAHWTLLEAGNVQRWVTQSDTAGSVLEEGVDQAADMLAARFARSQTDQAPGSLELLVNDVNTLADYAKAVRYLGSLDAVRGVHVVRVTDGRVWFRLEATGGDEAVGRAIALGRTLEAVDETDSWQFRLLP